MKLGLAETLRKSILNRFSKSLPSHIPGWLGSLMTAKPGSTVTLIIKMELDAETVSAYQAALGITHIKGK